MRQTVAKQRRAVERARVQIDAGREGLTWTCETLELVFAALAPFPDALAVATAVMEARMTTRPAGLGGDGE